MLEKLFKMTGVKLAIGRLFTDRHLLTHQSNNRRFLHYHFFVNLIRVVWPFVLCSHYPYYTSKNKHFRKLHLKLHLTRSWLRLKRLCAEPSPVSEPGIPQGHMTKGSCDITGKIPSREVIILPNLVAIDTLVTDTWWFLFATWPCKTTWSKVCMTLWLEACQDISSS